MQTIYLDISNKGVVPTIYAKQGDVGRKFEVVFTDSGIPYNIPTNAKISVWYEGDSGNGNYTDIGENSAIAIGKNKAVVELITQMLSEDGEGIICLVMNVGNDQIGSWNIRYLCEKVPGFDSEGAKEYYTAFSKTVEGLKQVTENLTPEAIGAAPAGYGLGERASNAPENDANKITKCGFFRAYVNTPTGDWWTIQQEDLYGDGTYMIQKASCYAYTFVLHAERIKVNGTFYEWEWVNPLLEPGIEYRTTERYKGKSVYTKLVNTGALPNNATTGLIYAENATALVSAIGKVLANGIEHPLPFFNKDTGGLEASIFQRSGNWVYISTFADLSAYTADITVKYTKD